MTNMKLNVKTMFITTTVNARGNPSERDVQVLNPDKSTPAQLNAEINV